MLHIRAPLHPPTPSPEIQLLNIQALKPRGGKWAVAEEAGTVELAHSHTPTSVRPGQFVPGPHLLHLQNRLRAAAFKN